MRPGCQTAADQLPRLTDGREFMFVVKLVGRHVPTAVDPPSCLFPAFSFLLFPTFLLCFSLALIFSAGLAAGLLALFTFAGLTAQANVNKPSE